MVLVVVQLIGWQNYALSAHFLSCSNGTIQICCVLHPRVLKWLVFLYFENILYVSYSYLC